MACGTPVIGSNVGGIKYSVQHECTGFLVPPHDPDAVGECTAHLLQNPELCRQFGREAVARVQSLFTWERVAKSVAEVYSQVLQPQPQPQRRPLKPIASMRTAVLSLEAR
jgi:glycosyltransferase involved in cell wall biosynthesis